MSNSGWQPLDMTGRGYFSAVAYKLSILNVHDLQKETEHQKKVAGYRLQNLTKFGKAQVEVVKLDEIVVINGLKWRHRLIAGYNATDLSAPSKGELTSWRDVYEHRIDETHVLRRIGRYDAMVVNDPAWIKARRELMRKLVEAVRIVKMPQDEVDAAIAEYSRQREQEYKGSGER